MRRLRRIGLTACLGAFAAVVAGAPAQALTLGDTTLPSGSTMGPACSTSSTSEVVQAGTDSSYAYTVPAGGGAITSWSFNTSGATPNTPYGLVIARPSGGNYQIVGTDSEKVPASLPSVATFTLTSPITVRGGDVLGVVITPHTNTVDCRFKGGSLPAADVIGNWPGNPTVGSSYGVQNTTPNELVNVSAKLVQSNDVAITQKVQPASITTGSDAAFVLSVTNSGPSQTPITLTDAIPAGLRIQSVSGGTAPCSVSGQNVSCTLTGAPASVAIVVAAPTAGAYANTAQARGTLTDPNPANNTAAATLSVTGQTGGGGSGGGGGKSSHCLVVALAGVPLAQAKTVLSVLGCTVGRVTKKPSKRIRRGDVISTNPRGGTTARLGTRVGIVISSGKPKKKHKKH